MTCTHDCNQGRECRCTDVSGWNDKHGWYDKNGKEVMRFDASGNFAFGTVPSSWSKRPESFNREYLEPTDQGTVIAILVACGVCACFTLIGVVTFVRWIV